MEQVSDFQTWFEDQFGKRPEWTDEDEERLHELSHQVELLERRRMASSDWTTSQYAALIAWNDSRELLSRVKGDY